MKILTILCVDDSEDIHQVYRHVLGRRGYQVVAAMSGADALRLFQCLGEAIDAVILDYEMPGMSGLQLAESLKEAKPKLPIIMVSGSIPAHKDLVPFVDAAIPKGELGLAIVNRLESLLAT